MKNPKIKKGTEVRISGRAYYYENFNFNDFEEIAVVERPTSTNPNLRYREGGAYGLADIILTIKGAYDFDKHGFTIGSEKKKVRIVIEHKNLVLVNR